MIVYTAIFNNYDLLNEIILPKGWAAVCFSDRKIPSKSWEIRVLEHEDKLHRRIKICPWEYLPRERCLWIDGNLKAKRDLRELDRPGFWVMQHPDRSHIYEEAAACIHLGKDNAETIMGQMARYHNIEVVATGVMVREPETCTDEFCAAWWSEVQRFSHRDQLSFTPMAELYDIKYRKLNFLEGFEKFKHLRRFAQAT